MFTEKKKWLIKVFLLTCVWVLIIACSGKTTQNNKKVLILGFDGMDPVLLEKYIAQDILPNFKLLKEQGSFSTLKTSMPPQSPVAWSNFITGMNPGGHGIFDFIARDPKTYLPYLSTSKTIESKNITLGNWSIPYTNAKTLLLRKGRAFWEILESNGIPTNIIKLPANYPPAATKGRSLSGMGTPDILGTYGTFSFYTTKEVEEEEVVSGKIYRVTKENNQIISKLIGPPNPLRKDQQRVSIDFNIQINSDHSQAVIKIQNREILLKKGEWSDWIEVGFRLAPFQKISGIVRFNLLQVRPDFELYVSPININPRDPIQRISTPKNYAAELAKEIGNFYTQGMPEDTKALDQGFLHSEDFLKQSQLILNERLKMLDLELKRFHHGLLMVYFGTVDLIQHMFWRNIDTGHPGYDAKEAEKYSWVIPNTYKKMDAILGRVMATMDPQTTLIVLSDHGFGSFRRNFSLNTWLRDNGYLHLKGDHQTSGEFFEKVDFSQTRAYGLGFNALYVNLSGREGKGIIPPGPEREKLLKELIQKLESISDPKTGEKVILKVYRREEIYSGDYLQDAPDLLIGYNRGYRASWETSLGKVTQEIFGDNLKKWSGTHLWDDRLVPGILLSNKKIKKGHPALYDIAPTILSEFRIKREDKMGGKPLF